MSCIRIVFLGVLLFAAKQSLAQQSSRDSTLSIHAFGFGGALQFPFADLNDRFGTNGSIGFAYYFKHHSNYLFGVEGNLLFGSNVKNNNLLAADIRTIDGFFLDNQGQLAEVLIQERGLDFRVVAGKIFKQMGPNANSGLFGKIGLGFLQHRIRFEARQNEVPQIEGEAQKGYDRLSNGLAVSQFIGYHQYGNKNRVNFSVGLEFIEAFTQSRRDYNIDLMGRDTKKRLDGLVGLKFIWMIPIVKSSSDQFYTY